MLLQTTEPTCLNEKKNHEPVCGRNYFTTQTIVRVCLKIQDEANITMHIFLAS